MGKYLLKRILFSVFSLLVVVMTVMFLVYTCIDRSVIFQTDDTWNKKAANDRVIYELNQYQKYGYLEYTDYNSFLKSKYQDKYGESYAKSSDYLSDKAVIQKPNQYLNNDSVKEFIALSEKEGKVIQYMEPVAFTNGKLKPGGTAYLVAIHEKPVVLRLASYIAHFFTIENSRMVNDPELTDRYVRFEKDPFTGGIALVGSGTNHKYLIYFDGKFPFIHQNLIHMNLGTSYTTYRGSEITTVINQSQGNLEMVTTQYPNMIGTDEYVETAVDFHSLTYNTGVLSDIERSQFPDKYTVFKYNRDGQSMVGISFTMGIIAMFFAYIIGIPLGILLARKKDSIADKIGEVYMVFIMAVPSLAYIFMFAAIGTMVFKLPYKFANAEVRVLGYILPIISLALPTIASLMRWMRRYMIDQMNSDYVKFARAEGLSEREIFSTHIARNALIPLVHSIPSQILGCLVGAIITERVYAVPGVGNLLTNAINSHDNGVIVACTVFYTALSLISVILGDLLLAKADPRISLTDKKGGGR